MSGANSNRSRIPRFAETIWLSLPILSQPCHLDFLVTSVRIDFASDSTIFLKTSANFCKFPALAWRLEQDILTKGEALYLCAACTSGQAIFTGHLREDRGGPATHTLGGNSQPIKSRIARQFKIFGALNHARARAQKAGGKNSKWLWESKK